MKKILFPLLLASLVLVACQKPNDESKDTSSEMEASSDVLPETSELTPTSSEPTGYQKTSLSIVSPTGAPALAFYDYANLSNFETNSNPTNIVAMMAAGQKDVVVLPTNAGVQAIKGKSAPYKLAATITFGNFYIASLNNDENNEMDASDTILLFQQGNVPDKIFHYVYGDSFNSNIHYVSAVNDAASALIAGSFVDAETGNRIVPNYVMIAEPALTNVLSKKDTVTVYADMQAKYKEKTGNKDLFQASVFIKNSVELQLANSFLASLKEDIEGAIADPSKLSTGMNKAEDAQVLFGVAPQMAENVLKKNNGMGLGFKYAKENKEGIENFLTIFGITGIDETIYF